LPGSCLIIGTGPRSRLGASGRIFFASYSKDLTSKQSDKRPATLPLQRQLVFTIPKNGWPEEVDSFWGAVELCAGSNADGFVKMHCRVRQIFKSTVLRYWGFHVLRLAVKRPPITAGFASIAKADLGT
jgi:hypothetical protein